MNQARCQGQDSLPFLHSPLPKLNLRKGHMNLYNGTCSYWKKSWDAVYSKIKNPLWIWIYFFHCARDISLCARNWFRDRLTRNNFSPDSSVMNSADPLILSLHLRNVPIENCTNKSLRQKGLQYCNPNIKLMFLCYPHREHQPSFGHGFVKLEMSPSVQVVRSDNLILLAGCSSASVGAGLWQGKVSHKFSWCWSLILFS